MRVLRFIARVLGWLLTPLVAVVASFLGAWLGATFTGQMRRPLIALWITVGLAALFALAAALGWMRLLRRSPELRHVLAVTEEGLPEAVTEPEPGEGP